MKTQGDEKGSVPAALGRNGAEIAFRRGFNTLQRRVNVRGVGAFSKHTASGRALHAWRGELIRDLGGEENLSTQQQTIIDCACRTKLLVDHLDAFLMAQESLVNKQRRTAYAVVQQRQVLSDALVRYLMTLGLKRIPKPVPTLAEYVKANKDEHSASDE
jgi:hypothetical protein